MTIKQKELVNIIETLPEELSIKVLDYIEYLKFSNMINSAPKELTIKDKKDLREKLKKGIEDFESGNVCTLEQAYSEVKKVLADD